MYNCCISNGLLSLIHLFGAIAVLCDHYLETLHYVSDTLPSHQHLQSTLILISPSMAISTRKKAFPKVSSRPKVTTRPRTSQHNPLTVQVLATPPPSTITPDIVEHTQPEPPPATRTTPNDLLLRRN